MIELARVVEHQASLSSFKATQNEERALQLELLIEITKPINHFVEWHPLISTPFRYSPPHPNARFRPPYGKNVFYGAVCEETALYEHAFYFMNERKHLKIETETGTRSIFSVDADNKNAIDLKNENNFFNIINKSDYSHSHSFVTENPHASFILYPSCRDPKNRNNAAILDIHHLEKYPKWESSAKFFYDHALTQLTWLDHSLHIQWREVSLEKK